MQSSPHLLRRPTPVPADPEFTAYVAACETACARDLDPSWRIAQLTKDFVRHWRMPDPRYLKPEPDAPYASYLLYLAPDAKLCIVLDVFLPGQAAVIHNHLCWCVFACLHGIEYERQYEVEIGSGLAPIESSRSSRMPGEVSRASASANGFHQVECASAEAAVSLHIYGADIGSITRQRWNGSTGAYEDFIGGYSNAALGLPTYADTLTVSKEQPS